MRLPDPLWLIWDNGILRELRQVVPRKSTSTSLPFKFRPLLLLTWLAHWAADSQTTTSASSDKGLNKQAPRLVAFWRGVVDTARRTVSVFQELACAHCSGLLHLDRRCGIQVLFGDRGRSVTCPCPQLPGDGSEFETTFNGSVIPGWFSLYFMAFARGSGCCFCPM